jgi:hypothetical protein
MVISFDDSVLYRLPLGTLGGRVVVLTLAFFCYILEVGFLDVHIGGFLPMAL